MQVRHSLDLFGSLPSDQHHCQESSISTELIKLLNELNYALGDIIFLPVHCPKFTFLLRR